LNAQNWSLTSRKQANIDRDRRYVKPDDIGSVANSGSLLSRQDFRGKTDLLRPQGRRTYWTSMSPGTLAINRPLKWL
jgi:hypothetical protein